MLVECLSLTLLKKDLHLNGNQVFDRQDVFTDFERHAGVCMILFVFVCR